MNDANKSNTINLQIGYARLPMDPCLCHDGHAEMEPKPFLSGEQAIFLSCIHHALRKQGIELPTLGAVVPWMIDHLRRQLRFDRIAYEKLPPDAAPCAICGEVVQPEEFGRPGPRGVRVVLGQAMTLAHNRHFFTDDAGTRTADYDENMRKFYAAVDEANGPASLRT